mmetsp:Transcript_9303/g.12097  ORF Transcript_9303/g.12097 Transcript_9303/m.12097 type:complete len:259 (+) Transcript_9303:357-1133(+)
MPKRTSPRKRKTARTAEPEADGNADLKPDVNDVPAPALSMVPEPDPYMNTYPILSANNQSPSQSPTGKRLKRSPNHSAPASASKSKSKRKVCIHGRPENGYLCKDCPGKGICKHRRQVYQCKECNGSSLCKHMKQRHQCKAPACKLVKNKKEKKPALKKKSPKKRVTPANLKGSRKLCIHGRSENGYLCRECPGKGICVHMRQKYQCKECGGTSICMHMKQKHQCQICKEKLPDKKSKRAAAGASTPPPATITSTSNS